MSHNTRQIVLRMRNASRAQIRLELRNESRAREVTKALLNLLYNIVVVGSVPISAAGKSFLDRNSAMVLALISKSRPLWWKKIQLMRLGSFVRVIAAACPESV